MPLVLGRAPASLSRSRPFGSSFSPSSCRWSVEIDPPGGRPQLALFCPAQPLLVGEEVSVRASVDAGEGGSGSSGGSSGNVFTFEGSGCSAVAVQSTSAASPAAAGSAATVRLPKPGRALLRATLRYESGGGAGGGEDRSLPLLLSVSASARLRAVAPFSLASATAASKPGVAALHSPGDVAAAIRAAAAAASGAGAGAATAAAAAAFSSPSPQAPPPLLPAGEPCVLSYVIRSEAPCAVVVEAVELVELAEGLELLGAATGVVARGGEGKDAPPPLLLLPGREHAALFVARSTKALPSSSSSSSSSPGAPLSACPPGKLSVRWRRAEPAALVAVGGGNRGGGASPSPLTTTPTASTSTTTLLPLPAVAFLVPLLTAKLSWDSTKPVSAGKALRLHLSVAATDPERAAGARLRLDVGDAHGFVVAAAPRRGVLPPLMPSFSSSSADDSANASSTKTTTTSTAAVVDVVPHAAGVLALPPVRLTVESWGGGGGVAASATATAATAAAKSHSSSSSSSSHLAVELDGASLDATAGLSVVVEPAVAS